MKQATEKVLDMLPVLKPIMEGEQSESNANLLPMETTFLQLVRFFENPNDDFNLNAIYDYLDNDWVEFSLEVIFDFFYKDTYLIKDKNNALVTDKDWYMNQSQFADFLAEHGLNFDRSKISIYVRRGNIPAADLIVAGAKYWEKSTCETYLQEQLKKENKSGYGYTE